MRTQHHTPRAVIGRRHRQRRYCWLEHAGFCHYLCLRLRHALRPSHQLRPTAASASEMQDSSGKGNNLGLTNVVASPNGYLSFNGLNSIAYRSSLAAGTLGTTNGQQWTGVPCCSGWHRPPARHAALARAVERKRSSLPKGIHPSCHVSCLAGAVWYR